MQADPYLLIAGRIKVEFIIVTLKIILIIIFVNIVQINTLVHVHSLHTQCLAAVRQLFLVCWWFAWV